MRNAIDNKLDSLRASGAHGLMAHIVVGYPDLAASERLLSTIADSGADLIELQIPFTDPVADGPTILKANLASLKNGIRVRDCFSFAERMAKKLTNVPLLFMTYINIPFNYGVEAFCRDSNAAGLAGLIVPDIPPEETAEDYHGQCLNHGLHPIYVLSPSCTDSRIEMIGARATGFLYATARVGITGARDGSRLAGLESFAARLRPRVKVPLALGFGLSSRAHVEEVKPLFDISVLGSRVIDLYNQGADEKAALAGVSSFLRSLC